MEDDTTNAFTCEQRFQGGSSGAEIQNRESGPVYCTAALTKPRVVKETPSGEVQSVCKCARLETGELMSSSKALLRA